MAGLNDIAARAGIESSQAQMVFDAIIERVNRGERVLIRGFGTFFRHEQRPRTVSSPVLGAPVNVPKRYTLRFKCSTTARDDLNTKTKNRKARG